MSGDELEQISAMNEAIANLGVSEKVEETPEETPAVVNEETTSEEIVSEEISTEESSDEPSDGSSEEAPSEVEQLKAMVEKLSARIEELSVPKKEETQSEPEVMDFLEGREIDEVFSEPVEVNKMLTKVYQKGVESVLRNLPQMVSNLVKTQTEVREKTKAFYSANQDLAAFKGVVAVVAQEISAKNPTMGLDKLYAETAVETRRRLNLSKPKPSTTKPSGFVTPGSSRTPAPTQSKPSPDPLADDITRMNQALGLAK